MAQNRTRETAKVYGGVGTLEMLEFSKYLDIDPVKESQMLWIAEEASVAKLPVGWSVHTDDQGNTYYHNSNSGKSQWSHPMDNLFREVVGYYRTVVHVGGFWTIDDELLALEDKIRKGLGNWLQLFDDKGAKYYFNRVTHQSTFCDPRNESQHELYTRIHMVAMMKERLPLLAAVERPRQIAKNEMSSLDRHALEERRRAQALMVLTGFCKVVKAKKEARSRREARDLVKGTQPLKDSLNLRVDISKYGGRDIVLAHTNEHHKYVAARLIQSHFRAFQARKHVKRMRAHRQHLNQVAIVIQRWVRGHLVRLKDRRRKQRILDDAAITIQMCCRAVIGWNRLKDLEMRRRERELKRKMVVKIQTQARMMFARKELRRRRVIKYTPSLQMLQKQIKIHLARRRLLENLYAHEPIQCLFELNTDSHTMTYLPWSLRMDMAPIADDHVLDPTYVNLFSDTCAEAWKAIAAVHIQRFARGLLARRALARRRRMEKRRAEERLRRANEEQRIRQESATTIQKVFRGWYLRHNNRLAHQRKLWFQRRLGAVKQIACYLYRYSEMKRFVLGVKHLYVDKAAACIQRHWRGWVARRHFEYIDMEASWPVKSLFDYLPTGPTTAYVTVQFFPNPRFNEDRYNMEFLHRSELNLLLDEMEFEVDFAVQDYLKSCPQQEVEVEGSALADPVSVANVLTPEHVFPAAIVDGVLQATLEGTPALEAATIAAPATLTAEPGVLSGPESGSNADAIAGDSSSALSVVAAAPSETAKASAQLEDTAASPPVTAAQTALPDLERAAASAESAAASPPMSAVAPTTEPELVLTSEVLELTYKGGGVDAMIETSEEFDSRASIARVQEDLEELRPEDQSPLVEEMDTLQKPKKFEEMSIEEQFRVVEEMKAERRHRREESNWVGDMSVDDHQQVAGRNAGQRRHKPDAVTSRRKTHDAKKLKTKRHEDSMSSDMAQISEEEEREKKYDELRDWLQQKEEKEKAKRVMETFALELAVDKLRKMGLQADQVVRKREFELQKRGRIAEKRQVTMLQGSRSHSALNSLASTLPFLSSRDSVVLPPPPGAAKMSHRHVHHHIHHHNPGDILLTGTHGSTHLPPLTGTCSVDPSGWAIGPSSGHPASIRRVQSTAGGFISASSKQGETRPPKKVATSFDQNVLVNQEA